MEIFRAYSNSFFFLSTGIESIKSKKRKPQSQSSSTISDVTSPVKHVKKFALGSKLPLVTRIARTGLGTRLKERVWELKEEGVVKAFTA